MVLLLGWFVFVCIVFWSWVVFVYWFVKLVRFWLSCRWMCCWIWVVLLVWLVGVVGFCFILFVVGVYGCCVMLVFVVILGCCRWIGWCFRWCFCWCYFCCWWIVYCWFWFVGLYGDVWIVEMCLCVWGVVGCVGSVLCVDSVRLLVVLLVW